MNAGLSNLTTLKAHLLTPALAASTDYDARIATVGAAMLGLIEQHTGRRIARKVGDTLTLPGGRTVFVLPRLPVETITAIEYREKSADAWTDCLADLDYYDAESGVVHLTQPPVSRSGQIRVTWTGGYWFEPLEPAASGYPTTMPDGATALPAELQAAWLLQCGHAWRVIDQLGTAIAEEPAKAAFPPIDLVLAVAQQLARWRVYTL